MSDGTSAWGCVVGGGEGGRGGGIWVFKPLEGDLALEVSQVL